MKKLLDEIERIQKRTSNCCCSNVVYNDEVASLCDRLKEALLHIQELRKLVHMVNELQENTSLTGDEWNDFVGEIMAEARALLEKRMSFEGEKE